MQDSSRGTIQRSYHCCLARRRMKQARTEYHFLRKQPGSKCLWQGAEAMLSRPQLHVALRQQGWAVVSLQQRILSCLEHKAWLQEASDVLSATRAVEATRIQSAWRHKEACHRAISAIRHHDMERNRQQVEQAASIIQRAMLGKWSRSRLRKLHRNELFKVLGAAATDIQRVWCGHASRNLVRNRINLVELQRYNQERHHTLALRLQLGMRCFWARRELTDRYWETKSQLACTAIQCAARVWLARNEFQIHIFEEVQRRKISAVLTVQAFGFSSTPARRRPLARCVFCCVEPPACVLFRWPAVP